MIFFPAIDLKNGKCVRLEQGDANRSKIFDENPYTRASLFKNSNCKWIHIVDLDGAFLGKPVNHKVVEKILNIKNIKIQLGGGIRNIQTIDTWIELGVKRVILGTAAIKNPKLVFEACEKYPGQIVLGLDVRNEEIALEGWLEQSEVRAYDIAKKFENIGLGAIVYTDISRDGLLEGLAIEKTANFAKKQGRELYVYSGNFAKKIKTPVIASGGVSSEKDLLLLKKKEKMGIEGVISGRAIYEGKLDIKRANTILENLNAKS